ncbi:MFS domain-containing protein [Fusarium falciforme]|uniref:MFS domain-containing protein n=1 Tax=Fusarium falciforme TaxID=195108 RepID=UPI002301B1B0|nr:MFS domain-containing protein [Fusarium falciforme]WAO91217.1 MFS domain-containing protein [Fusarium falciforme]
MTQAVSDPEAAPRRSSVAKIDVHDQAIDATIHEHSLGFWQALRLYPKAIGWAAYFSLGIIVTAFDPQLIGQLIATPAFQRAYGREHDGEFYIAAPWQSALNMGAPIGQIFGAFTAGSLMEKIGRKKSFGLCTIAITGCVFIQFFSGSLAVLFVGELFAGLVLGVFVTIAPAYASEVAPLAVRGVVTASINLCFAGGQLMANGTVARSQKLDSRWAFRIPFAVQWLWPLIIVAGFPFAPESPWWLQRQGRLEEAERALKKLSSSSVDVKATLAMIIETDRAEQEIQVGSKYLDCFKGSNRRRTHISIGVICIQVFSGVYLATYATYFFQLGGLPTSQSFNMSLGMTGLGAFGTILSWFTLSYLGRRILFVYGLAILTALQFVIGALDCAPNYENRPGFAWAESVVMLIWYFIYSITIGPVAYVFLCEVSAVRVRGKTIAIALAAQGVATIFMTVCFPYMVNPDEGNMRGKIGFFFGGLAFCCLIWSWFKLPELKGMTFHEVDCLFAQGTKARDFKRTNITDGVEMVGAKAAPAMKVKEDKV